MIYQRLETHRRHTHLTFNSHHSGETLRLHQNTGRGISRRSRQHGDLHFTIRRAIIRLILGDKLHLERVDAEGLSRSNLQDRPGCRLIFELTRHIRRRLKLTFAQCRSGIDVARLEPRQLRLGQGDIDGHTSLQDVVLSGVLRRELGPQRLAIASLEHHTQCRIILKHTWHIRPRTQLHLTKRCTVNKALRLGPLQHRVVRYTCYHNCHRHLALGVLSRLVCHLYRECLQFPILISRRHPVH